MQQALVEWLKALLARSPAFVWRVLKVAFSPSLILRKLALVSLLQLLAYGLKLLLRAQRHNPLTGDRSARSMASATTFEDWEKAHHDQPPQQMAPLPPELQLYCRMLDEGADNYMRLMASGDMHGLMFRLRSELMRGAAGGNGYNRDGNVSFTTAVLLWMYLLWQPGWQRNLYNGCTYYGSTYYGPTYYGSTYYGSTYHGSTYHGSTYHRPVRVRVVVRFLLIGAHETLWL